MSNAATFFDRRAQRSRIQAGSGVYTCECCGKRTRETGDGESFCQLCAKCYFEGGLVNEHSDNDGQHDLGPGTPAGPHSDCPLCRTTSPKENTMTTNTKKAAPAKKGLTPEQRATRDAKAAKLQKEMDAAKPARKEARLALLPECLKAGRTALKNWCSNKDIADALKSKCGDHPLAGDLYPADWATLAARVMRSFFRQDGTCESQAKPWKIRIIKGAKPDMSLTPRKTRSDTGVKPAKKAAKAAAPKGKPNAAAAKAKAAKAKAARDVKKARKAAVAFVGLD